MNKQIRVFICDDHEVVREGLIRILSKTPDIITCGEAENGAELLEKIKEIDCDVLVLDLVMPIKDGWQVIKQLTLEHPNLPIIILSMHPEAHFAIRCLKAGASGYLAKSSAPQELVRSIKKVCSGGTYISAELGEKLAFDMKVGSHLLPHEALSEREFQIFMMLVSGKLSKEIAEELRLSAATVSTHKTNILVKMGMTGVSELTEYAIRQGLKS